MDNRLTAVKMKEVGLANSIIAKRLGINIGTVESYVREVKETASQKLNVENCLGCGKEMEKKRSCQHFCSRTCRYEWWKNNMLLSPSKAVRVFKCKGCGKTFVTYGEKERKYCSHACYIKDRFENEKRTL